MTTSDTWEEQARLVIEEAARWGKDGFTMKGSINQNSRDRLVEALTAARNEWALELLGRNEESETDLDGGLVLHNGSIEARNKLRIELRQAIQGGEQSGEDK